MSWLRARPRGGVAEIALIALVISGCADRQRGHSIPQSPVVLDEIPFVDSTETLAVDAVYRNGEDAGYYSILESLGGGVGWLDFDSDGYVDVIVPQGGELAADSTMRGLPTALFRNRGGTDFQKIEARAGLGARSLYTHGVAVADYDNDGFPDVLVTGYGPTQLWHNLGDGTFALVNEWIGAEDDRWSSSAGWADFDNDGNVDLYVVRYVDWSFENNPYCGSRDFGQDICPPREFLGLPDSIYANQGDGSFVDRSAEAGLRTDGKGLGVVLADLDVDGDVDIYVANDTVENFLYENDGAGMFEERGLQAGVSLDDEGIPNGSMGVELCDVNRDGLPDLWVANYEREAFALYRGGEHGQFLHVSRRYGIASLGGLFVGFGTACKDFDSDGFVDIAVANGHVIKYPRASPRRQEPLLLSLEADRFRRLQAKPGSYFGTPHEGRGLAAGDFDNDGDLDLAISNLNEPVAILTNRFPESRRRVGVTLVGRRSNRDGVGAKVALLHDGVVVVETQVPGGGSYLSHHHRRVMLTWSDGDITDGAALTVRVAWPSGQVDEVQVPPEMLGSGTLRIVESRELQQEQGA